MTIQLRHLIPMAVVALILTAVCVGVGIAVLAKSKPIASTPAALHCPPPRTFSESNKVRGLYVGTVTLSYGGVEGGSPDVVTTISFSGTLYENNWQYGWPLVKMEQLTTRQVGGDESGCVPTHWLIDGSRCTIECGQTDCLRALGDIAKSTSAVFQFDDSKKTYTVSSADKAKLTEFLKSMPH